MNTENELVTQLTHAGWSVRRALKLLGISRSTWHYRHRPRRSTGVRIPHKIRHQPTAIKPEVVHAIQTRIKKAWAQGDSVNEAYATAWDEGVMLASVRSWWRIAARMDNAVRPARAQRATRTAGTSRRPCVQASGPNQAWCWDITNLPGQYRGVTFKAYVVMDMFSRKIIAAYVHERESAQSAVELFAQAIAAEGCVPAVVHADNGSAMRSMALQEFFAGCQVKSSFSRPRVSNDNPFSESLFKTLKYRSDYPGVFTDLEHARAYIKRVVDWYNTQHHHSGLGLFTPVSVHDGSWVAQQKRRQDVLDAYREKHPDRFHRAPVAAGPAEQVGINLVGVQ
ncbi:IS3 family transposase [Agromyces atrinae]|uniref:IS3 family transposase n=1 Tax=Agromyces atrinae TaxID=592376 RepID=UPI002411230B|nr:IS3 family transposase [Agromyces atrinae]